MTVPAPSLAARRAANLGEALELLRACVAAWPGSLAAPVYVAAARYLEHVPPGRGNRLGEVLTALRALTMSVSVDDRGELYRRAAAVAWSTCRSCADPPTPPKRLRRNLCPLCWAIFSESLKRRSKSASEPSDLQEVA
jgi:hypothetical protein